MPLKLFTFALIFTLFGCEVGWPGHMMHMNPISQSSKPQNGAGPDNFLEYDEKIKTGILKYAARMEERDLALKKIEAVCNTKNVAIQSGGAHPINAATYTTLDERYINKSFVIKFQCLY